MLRAMCRSVSLKENLSLQLSSDRMSISCKHSQTLLVRLDLSRPRVRE